MATVPAAVAVLWLAITPTLAAGQPASRPDDVAAALENALDGSFQSELPTARGVPDDTGGAPELRPSLIVLPPIVVRALWIVLIALTAFWLARVFLLPVLPVMPGAKEPDDEQLGAYTESEIADLPLPDHAALASSQRFAEAVHVLFLRALLVTARRLRAPLPAALTSREVLGRWRLGPQQREDLGAMALLVERGHFGGYELDSADYDACHERYERLRTGGGAVT